MANLHILNHDAFAALIADGGVNVDLRYSIDSYNHGSRTYKDVSGCYDSLAGSSLQSAVSALRAIQGVESVFTGSGKPRTDVLEAILGTEVTAAERDAAWEAGDE